MEDLEKDIRNRLIWDDRIDDTQIEIIAKNGKVTLRGCVTNYPEKILAEIETQMIPGVKSVVNEIEVKFPDSTGITTDKNVEEAMYCLLDAYSEIDSNDVNVSIHDGVVKLTGKVNTYWKKYKIEKLASQIIGVNSVENKISVIPDKMTSDQQILEFLQIAFRDSVHVDPTNINIKVDIGIVTLSGTISSMSEHDAILSITRSIKGVVGIIDELKWILRYQTT